MKCKVEFVKMSESEEGKKRKERRGKRRRGGGARRELASKPSNRDEERGWKDACGKLTSQGGSPCAVIGFSPAS